MKLNHMLALLFSLFVASSLLAQKNESNLTITKLTENFYIFTTYQVYGGSRFPANGMYVTTEEGVILIDTPWDTTQFQPLLDSIEVKHQQRVVLCIATHSHEDRTGGLEFLRQRGVKTYTSKKTDKLCKERNRKRAEFTFEKDTTFVIGNYSFQAFYPGEGHTPDNIVTWFPKEKVLYGGCLIKSTEAQDLGNLGDANVKAWPATLQRLQKQFKNPAYIIPGHQGWSSVNSLEHTLKMAQIHESKNR